MWNVPSEAFVFFYISIATLSGAVFFIIFLFASRLIKNRSVNNEGRFRDRFQKSINVILQMDSSDDEPAASHQFYFSQLITDMGESDLAKQVMIDQLIGLRKSLSGSYARSLTNVYLKLKLDKFSLQKLESHHWKRRAQGIAELSQMEIEASIKKIRSLLQSTNATIRDEALIGLVKLDRNKSLNFFDHYAAPISSWMVMRIHQQLSLSDKRLLPDFSQWYEHQNIDVAIFAIEMTRQFRQINNASKLIELFNHNDLRIVELAVDVCGELHVQEAAEMFLKIIEKYWNDYSISASLARGLGNTAHAELHWKKIVGYLSHPNYTVKFEAAKSLYNTDATSRELLNSAHFDSGGLLDAILNHVRDPLLQS